MRQWKDQSSHPLTSFNLTYGQVAISARTELCFEDQLLSFTSVGSWSGKSRVGRIPALAGSGQEVFPSSLEPQPINQATKNLNCRLCGMDFRDREQLLIHESVHMGKKLHRCTHCGKCFRLRSNLTTHERKHTGEKPYSCRYCRKQFASSSNCKIHERCHTGEKPFKCRFCDMCFITSSNCRKHERRHTGEKPFVCHICGRAFTTQRSLKGHVIKHTNAMLVAQSRSRETMPPEPTV